jgi:hypothetical protein
MKLRVRREPIIPNEYTINFGGNKSSLLFLIALSV